MIIDLLAGPGGWSEALRMLGADEVGIDNDPAACDTAEAAGHTPPDIARILGVPNVYTRYDPAALDEFNAGVERARRAYHREPFAGSHGMHRSPVQARKLAAAGVTTKTVRAWALANGHPVTDRGNLPQTVVDAYLAATTEGATA